MEFMTLHDFMFWTKGMAYVGMGVGLVAFVAFWLFLTERDEDKFADKEEEYARSFPTNERVIYV